MEDLAGFCASCPWRNETHCPRAILGSPGGAPLNVRVDISREGFLACACWGLPASGTPDVPHPSRDSLPWGRAPYLEATAIPLGEVAKGGWRVLQGLLKNPMDGLAAVGLQLLPERLQDILLSALADHRAVSAQLNLSPGAIPSDRFALLAFRALAVRTGIHLEIVEETSNDEGPTAPDPVYEAPAATACAPVSPGDDVPQVGFFLPPAPGRGARGVGGPEGLPIRRIGSPS